MGAVDWPTIGVMVALGALLWRQTAALDTRLTAALLALSDRVGDMDRRLARLEGWIEGERAGRGRTEQAGGGLTDAEASRRASAADG